MSTFSFDAETDGLYGDAWAIGAVAKDGDIEKVFAGQVDSSDLQNEWVRQNVAPFVSLPRYESARALRDAFWAFWLEHREGAVCIADFGSPVESGLFRACVADDLDTRQWLGPYPLHEVGTALLCAGIDPDIDRIEFSGLTGLVKHNPVDDARASLACWLKARHANA
jgi:hypothetical protein